MSLDFNPENRTTWKEAIDAVLIKLGREPLTTTPSDGVALDPEADAVRNHLDRVTREVLMKGWHFNTVKRTLAVAGGEINLDADILEFDPDDPDIAVIDDQLYNVKTDTSDEFDGDVTGWAIIAHDLIDCPEAVRQYIYSRAAVELASSQFAETDFLPRLQEQETRALARLLSSERRVRNKGLRSNSEIARRVGYRWRRLRYH